MAAAEPKPSLVERLFADYGAGCGHSSCGVSGQVRCSGSRSGGVPTDAAGERPRRDPQSCSLPLHGGEQPGEEHAVLERRQANGIDIEQAPAHEQLETLPAFDGDLDAAQRLSRLGTVLQQLRPKCRAAVELRFTHELSYRQIALPPRSVPAGWRRSTWRRG